MADRDLWRVPYSGQQIEDSLANSAPRINASGRWEIWSISSSSWVDTGIEASGKAPYIGDDHYWYVWDASQNTYVKTEYTAAITGISTVNGIFPAATGNLTLPWTGIDGANPIHKGGTGATTEAGAVGGLINGLSNQSSFSNLNRNDSFAYAEYGGNRTGRKVRLGTIGGYFNNNLKFAKSASGHYVGTGAYGVDNPNSLTFEFAPKIVSILSYGTYRTYSNTGESGYYTWNEPSGTTVLMDALQTDYVTGLQRNIKPMFEYSSQSPIYAKKSEDGMTLSWYSSGGGQAQLNSAPGQSTSTSNPYTYESHYFWVAYG